MIGRLVTTSVSFGGGVRFSVEPDEETGTMEFFAECRASNGEVLDSFVTSLSLDEMEYLAKRILDAVDFERKNISPCECECYGEEVPTTRTKKEYLEIRDALIRCNSDRKRAAEMLHISERTLYRKAKIYGLI